MKIEEVEIAIQGFQYNGTPIILWANTDEGLYGSTEDGKWIPISVKSVKSYNEAILNKAKSIKPTTENPDSIAPAPAPTDLKS